jgi:hypothetical protein
MGAHGKILLLFLCDMQEGGWWWCRDETERTEQPAIAKFIGFEERGSHPRPLRHFQYQLYVVRSFLHLGGRRGRYQELREVELTNQRLSTMVFSVCF